jgi:hypothetical protein
MQTPWFQRALAPAALLAALGLTGFTLTGCDVEQTEEGNLELPEYEKVDDGDVSLPKYDVDAADVEVGTTDVEIPMPTVDVEMPDEEADTPRDE